MSIGSWIGDRLNIKVPIMTKHPYERRGEIKRYLESCGYTNVKYRWSGNRGFLGIQRYLDVIPERDQYWAVRQSLEMAGIKFRA